MTAAATPSAATATADVLLLAARDTMRGLERSIESGLRGLAAVALGMLVAWWIYVPIHELLHAAGCLWTGGSVDRLEIAPQYGGAILARIFPFVVSGGEYAGRLAGFDTGGSDWVYLATDFAPYLLSIFPGVWLLRRGARTASPLLFGLALPVALAPFISLPGDAYEIGSLAVTQLPLWSDPAARELVRGDDVFRVAAAIAKGPAPAAAWVALGLSLAVGVVWAVATFALGGLVARLAGEGPVPPLQAPVEGGPGN